uniref:CD3 gamma/delta n=1 Tax=Crotalus horridus TaxID=35024 RepID=T1E6Z3_CROHD
MGGQEQLLCAAVLALFFQGISISGNAASGNEFITIEQKGKNVSLICEGGDNKTHWIKDRMDLTYQGKELALAVMDDPRGIYKCIIQNGKSRSVQVFIRMCQNCIHLDFTMILGISAASLLATIFLAIAVYHIAVEERGRPTQASDKQRLLANDQLYQPLQEHNDRPYSHIGIAKPRRR